MTTLKVTPSKLKRILPIVLGAGLVPMVHGSPGIGKSDINNSLAQTYGLELIDCRLAAYEPPDLNGFPSVDADKGVSSYLPFDTFPTEDTPIPQGKNGWLLHLDELPGADPDVQKAAYKLILDRMVGNKKLHPQVAVVAAGNLVTDNAFVEEMSKALGSRMVHFCLEVSVEDWLLWARAEKLDHTITSFIEYRPELLHNFDPKSPDFTYPAPRTWAHMDKLKKQNPPEDLLDFIAVGSVGEGAGLEYTAYLRVFNTLPSLDTIINEPFSARVPNEPSTLYALASTLGFHLTMDNAEKLVNYINRLPPEFQVLAFREARDRDKSILSSDAVRAWTTNNIEFMKAVV